MAANDELQKLTGVKMYLRRKYSDAGSLADLADQCFSEASDEVVITQTQADGSGATGIVRFPKWLLLTAIEEVMAERDCELEKSTRVIGTRPDYSRTWSVT